MIMIMTYALYMYVYIHDIVYNVMVNICIVIHWPAARHGITCTARGVRPAPRMARSHIINDAGPNIPRDKWAHTGLITGIIIIFKYLNNIISIDVHYSYKLIHLKLTWHCINCLAQIHTISAISALGSAAGVVTDAVHSIFSRSEITTSLLASSVATAASPPTSVEDPEKVGPKFEATS